MTKKPIILGIESSCDETAIAIIKENEHGVPKILSSIVSSQMDIHKELINEPHPKIFMDIQNKNQCKELCFKMIGPCLFIGINCISVGIGYTLALYL